MDLWPANRTASSAINTAISVDSNTSARFSAKFLIFDPEHFGMEGNMVPSYSCFVPSGTVNEL